MFNVFNHAMMAMMAMMGASLSSRWTAQLLEFHFPCSGMCFDPKRRFGVAGGMQGAHGAAVHDICGFMQLDVGWWWIWSVKAQFHRSSSYLVSTFSGGKHFCVKLIDSRCMTQLRCQDLGYWLLLHLQTSSSRLPSIENLGLEVPHSSCSATTCDNSVVVDVEIASF